MWEGDLIEEYDVVNKSGNVIFEDKINAIIGYNYAENLRGIVQLLSDS